MTNTEKRLEGSRMYGKSTRQGMFLLECIYKGEEYAVFESIKNRVHIIPDKKLKEIINQALAEDIAEDREMVDKWLKERRSLEVSALESSKLVPDRHYHKGKIHLIDDLLSLDKLTDKE